MALSKTSRQYIAFMATMNLGFYVFQSYYILFLTANGLTFTDISLIFLGNFLALAMLNFVAGNFADRSGRKKAILIGGVINVIGFVVYGLSSSLWLFLAAEIILAGSSALIMGSIEAWFVDELKAKKLLGEASKAFPANSSISNILGIVGGVIGSMLVAYALNLPMLAGAVLVGASTLFALFFFTENYGERGSRFSGLIRESLAHFRGSRTLRNLTYGEMFRNSAVIVYLIVYQPYMVAIGLERQYLGVFFSILAISIVLGNLLSVRAADRVGRHRLLAIICMMLFVAYLVQPFVHDYLIAGALFAFTGFTTGLALPPVIIWRNSLIPSRIRASTLAVLSSILNLGAGISTLVLGILIDSSSMQIGMFLGAVLALAAMPFYLIAKKHENGAKDELKETAAA
jgi:MFS family permease